MIQNKNNIKKPKKAKKIKKNSKKKVLIILAAILITILFVSGSVIAYQVFIEIPRIEDNNHYPIWEGGGGIKKPVIYLYPTKTENVKVELDYSGKLISTYPDYNQNIKGWEVTAKPDGSLLNHQDGKEYSYLFWEGISDVDLSNFNTGFVVKGSDTKEFLQSTLNKLGLTAKEYNEMIVYWLPKMENNKYNLIHFAGEEYTQTAKLKITPTPDSILRVFMVFKPLNNYQQISPQQLKSFQRKGFAVVEWGGTEVK